VADDGQTMTVDTVEKGANGETVKTSAVYRRAAGGAR
jgi:hypothetical protein